MASQKEIIETIEEVMSHRQFQNDQVYHWGEKFPHLSSGFGYVFVILILCCFLFFLFVFTTNHFQKKETKSKRALTKAKKQTISPPLPINPIKRLHAEFLHALQEKKVVNLQKWKTNSDYIQESKNLKFQKVCILYDAAIFGAKEVSYDAVSLLREEFITWEKGQ